MITEDYCSYEVAKLLEEKGFKEPVTKLNRLLFEEGKKPLLKITHQKAMKWLREVYKIYIVVSPISGKGYNAILCDVSDFDDFNYIGETDYFFHPEEAVEAGIKYCLENLI